MSYTRCCSNSLNLNIIENNLTESILYSLLKNQFTYRFIENNISVYAVLSSRLKIEILINGNANTFLFKELILDLAWRRGF